MLRRCDELEGALAAKQEECALLNKKCAQLEEQWQAGRAALAALQVGAPCLSQLLLSDVGHRHLLKNAPRRLYPFYRNECALSMPSPRCCSAATRLRRSHARTQRPHWMQRDQSCVAWRSRRRLTESS